MTLRRTALKLGIQAIQAKLGEAYGDPGFSAFEIAESPDMQERPAVTPGDAPVNTRSALLRPPRIIETR